MIIDFHNHLYPESYLDELRSGRSKLKLTEDEHGMPVLHFAGDYNIIVDGHRKPQTRIEEMKKFGVDKQVLSFTAPGLDVEEPETAVSFAHVINDSFAEVCSTYPESFVALAALPMKSPEEAASELDRAVKDLGMKGAILLTHVEGRALDSAEFRPVFETAAKLDATIFIHPTSPFRLEMMENYRLTALVGFLYDTTLAVSRLLFSGLFDEFPDLKLVLAHLGGALPYMAERLDRGYAVYPEIHDRIKKPPSDYLKQLYYDTVSFHPPALTCAIEFAGVDRLVLGSDYPHQIGSIEQAVKTVNELKIDSKQKDAILGDNARKLLKI